MAKADKRKNFEGIRSRLFEIEAKDTNMDLNVLNEIRVALGKQPLKDTSAAGDAPGNSAGDAPGDAPGDDAPGNAAGVTTGDVDAAAGNNSLASISNDSNNSAALASSNAPRLSLSQQVNPTATPTSSSLSLVPSVAESIESAIDPKTANILNRIDLLSGIVAPLMPNEKEVAWPNKSISQTTFN